jgi:hypothetical protein
MSGAHKGDFPRIPATGKRFSSVRGTTVLELEAGKIRRESDYWDTGRPAAVAIGADCLRLSPIAGVNANES